MSLNNQRTAPHCCWRISVHVRVGLAGNSLRRAAPGAPRFSIEIHLVANDMVAAAVLHVPLDLGLR